MDIASMLEREDFYTILQNTLQKYYQQVHDREIRIEYEPFEGCETLYIHARLSFISRKKVPAGAREFLYNEYNIRGSFLKFLAGKVLVFMATHCGGLGAVRKLYITRGVLGENAFISPQNRSVRIFDYDRMTVDCIIKEGFTSRYFNNQLAFRKQYAYDFVLPLIDSGEGWFRERIMRGHALARVTDEAVYTAAQETALSYIDRLAADTATEVSAGAYIESLAAEIRGKLHLAEEKKQVATDTLLVAVDRIESTYKGLGAPILLALGHGDLQTGNIWVENDGRVWLYDWETQGKRSVWYDRATLVYATRRAGGLERFLTAEDLSAFCREDCSPAKTCLIQDTVLLEEMLFYLDDLLELPGTDGAVIFERFVKRVQTVKG
ncbi:MAG: hypothetical protein IJC17_04025 [Clostridia bacterium]|nr:hypothetical protein [Clostridia bacterium]